MRSSFPNQQSPVPNETQHRGALVLRAVPILLLPIVASFIGVLLLRVGTGGPFRPPDEQPLFGPLIPIVVTVVFFTSLIILVRLGRPTISALTLIGVWTLITTLAALRGGVASYVPALLIIPICTAGLLIDGVACVSLAALGTLLVGSMAWLEVHGLMPPPETPPAFIAANMPFLAVVFWLGLFATVAGLTSLLAGSLQRALRQSRAQAHALQELSAQLEARVAAQTAQLVEQEREAATLEERARLARDIHDTLAQGLTGIVVQLGAAQRALVAAPGEAEPHIDLAQRMARESLAEARRSVWNLRAAALERGDLGDALRGLVARPLRPQIAGRFEQRGAAWPLPPGVESALLRVCQEALVNVARHAGATEVAVLLEYRPDAVRLSIGDNGVGFDDLSQEVVAPGPWGGFGLLGMRERIWALGGTLELANNGGAHVIAMIPKAEEERWRGGGGEKEH